MTKLERNPNHEVLKERLIAFCSDLVRLRLMVCFVVIGLWFSAAAQETKPRTSVAELQQALSNHITQPKFAAAMWGVKVVSVETGKSLFEHDAHKLFSPASNSK